MFDVRATYRGRTYSLMAVPYDHENEAIERKKYWEGVLPYVEFWVERLDPNDRYEPLPSDLVGAIKGYRRAMYLAQKVNAGEFGPMHDPRFEQAR